MMSRVTGRIGPSIGPAARKYLGIVPWPENRPTRNNPLSKYIVNDETLPEQMVLVLAIKDSLWCNP